MVLIAIDRQRRKILGYLCKNNQILAYCCSECEVEFTTAPALEDHMVTHEEKPTTEKSFGVADENKTETSSEDSTSLQSLFSRPSNIEKENLLKIKYQITPCSVHLYRYELDNEQADSDEVPPKSAEIEENVAPEATEATEPQDALDVFEEFETPETREAPVPPEKSKAIEVPEELKAIESLDTPVQEETSVALTTAPLDLATPTEPEKLVKTIDKDESVKTEASIPLSMQRLPPLRGRPPKKRADPSSQVAISAPKRPKMNKGLSTKRITKIKSLPAVCFLCGEQFQTNIQLVQHQKTHLPRTDSPVFPCNVCGQQVKNLKIHLRQHKTDGKRVKSSESNKLNGSGKSGEATKSLHTANRIGPSKSVQKVKKEEASSSTDAVFTKVSCDKEPESVSSNEAQTNSHDSNSAFSSIDKQSDIAAIPNTAILTVDPLYPSTIRKLTSTEHSGENEPSQSTQPVIEPGEQSEPKENGIEHKDTEEADDMEKSVDQPHANATFVCTGCPRRFDSEARLLKHQKKHDKKLNCSICGKLLALSYVKMHIKKYHGTCDYIPLNAQVAT